jgi:hypothetical protein
VGDDDGSIESQDETPGVGDGETTGVHADVTVKTAVETVNEQEEIKQELNDQYGERKHEHRLRPRRPRDYKHVHTQLENIVMTQHSIKKGLKIFGEAGAEAVTSDMKQLHDRSVIDPKSANMLTREEKRKALSYLMFLKKKRCGRIKGRGCADGRKQRIYKTKEETSAPMVAVARIPHAVEHNRRKGTAHSGDSGHPRSLHAGGHGRGPAHEAQEAAGEVTNEGRPAPIQQVPSDGKREAGLVRATAKITIWNTRQAALLFWKDLTGIWQSGVLN